MKAFGWLMAGCFSISCVHSQTLFSYGGKKVSSKEFLTAFKKNPNQNADRKTALKEYLNTFINYKLKLQSAYDEKLNESESYKIESNNFKKQIADNIINEEANEKKLLQQAFERSRKDILIQQIFVEFGTDSAAAIKKINAVFNELKKGRDFSSLVVANATDSATKKSKGYIGYITAFSLPYEIENIVYGLASGGYSTPYKSKFGYHIFKAADVRKAVGRRNINQILVTFPPKYSEADKNKTAALAENIYQQLNSGMPFKEAQKKYSNKQNENVEMGIGEYSENFEKNVFDLSKVGDYSKPFATEYGYNIVQLQQIVPLPSSAEDLYLKEKIENSGRLSIAKKDLIQKLKIGLQFKRNETDANALAKFTDSSLRHLNTQQTIINDNTILFSVNKEQVFVKDFINHLRLIGINTVAVATIKEQLKNFEDLRCEDYYRKHIDEYNAKAKDQLTEFNEANLLFTVMDKHVWSIASIDSIQQKKYYDANAAKYQWQQGFSAIIVSAKNNEVANEIAGKIKTNPNNWRNIIPAYNAFANADSGRYETQQFTQFKQQDLQQDMVIGPKKIEEDNYVFYYITAIHLRPGQRSFDEARGFVANDYQQIVEAQWIRELKKKYPVKMDESVWKNIK